MAILKMGADTVIPATDQVKVINGINPSGTMNITSNGTQVVREYDRVNVNVVPNLQDKTVTQNGTYQAENPYDGLGTVEVALSLSSKTISHNGTYYAASDDVAGFNTVEVNVPLDQKTITRNGTYRASDDNLDGFNKVIVNYDFYRQDRVGTNAITQNGMYTFDSGYDGLGTVEVALQVGEKPQTITANGSYVSSTDNLAGYSSLVVAVDVNNENRTFTTNGVYTPTQGKNGMYQVTVDVPAQNYLNNIRTALTNLGLTPPASDADLDTFITTTFTDIHNQLSSIHGES